MNYDIIGDIHGHADALKALLKEMGYRETKGSWRHLERKAIFVGDFVDRGPQQYDTFDLVRRMVDSGNAAAVMGNHEFNAIAWFLPDQKVPGEFLRRHHSAKYGNANFKQHERFLSEVADSPRHQETVEWFLTLPLYLELDDIRVVHACWHKDYMNFLSPHLTAERRLTKDLMIAATCEPEDEADKDTTEPTVFKAVETLLKGIEIPLPSSNGFLDKDGHSRSRVRTRWWDRDAVSYRDAAMLPESERSHFPVDPIPEHVRLGHDGGKPVFVGHYWLKGKPSLLATKVACLDYSVAKGGQLVAYRYEGETDLVSERFFWAK